MSEEPNLKNILESKEAKDLINFAKEQQSDFIRRILDIFVDEYQLKIYNHPHPDDPNTYVTLEKI